jgi:hypothetical protein
MDPKIDDYIKANRDKYTPEAIRAQLIAAGHDPTAIAEALQADSAGHAAQRPTGWRLGWRSFLILVVLGAIGAGLIWQNQMYSAGGIAAAIYAVIAGIALGLGRGISVLVDRGQTGAAAALLAVIGGIGALFLVSGNSLILAAAAVLVAAGLAAGLLAFRRSDPGRASLLGAAIPIVFWLAVTGTCYAPIFGPGVVQPTEQAGTMELRIEPPLSFSGSGGAICTIYAGGFGINSDSLGMFDGMNMGASVSTAGDPNVPAPSLGEDRSVIVTIALNSPTGGGYVTYGSPVDKTFTSHLTADGVSGSVAFDGLERQTAEGPGASGAADTGPISGTVTWTCE